MLGLPPLRHTPTLPRADPRRRYRVQILSDRHGKTRWHRQNELARGNLPTAGSATAKVRLFTRRDRKAASITVRRVMGRARHDLHGPPCSLDSRGSLANLVAEQGIVSLRRNRSESDPLTPGA